MSKSLEQLEKENKDDAMQDAGQYVEKLYKRQHQNKKYVKCIVKSKDGKVVEVVENEYALPYKFEDIVLNLYGEATGMMLGGIDVTRENLKSIEIVFE